MQGINLADLHKKALNPRAVPPTFLPDPEPRDRTYAIVSVDDHLLEPPDIFSSRLSANQAERSPQFITRPDGAASWVIDGDERPISLMNACAGRPESEWGYGAVSLDEVRKGAWDADARVHDMDIAGVYASLGFPSITWGFAGQSLSKLADQAVGLACVRAFNDWVVEEWTASHPDRLIPCQLPWLSDMDVAVQEIHRNAARGVHAVTFSENPAAIGFPSLYTDYWDPFFAACQETGTVLNLHVGSASWTPVPSADSPPACSSTLFALTSAVAVAEWLWSFVPVRFPELRMVLSEGGLGWVPMIHDRLVHMRRFKDSLYHWPDATDPAEVLKRSFRFASYFDPMVWRVIDAVGVDSVVVEVDYPHSDSTWPNCQEMLDEQIAGLDVEVVRKVTYENACELYRHPLPPPGWASTVPTDIGAPAPA